MSRTRKQEYTKSKRFDASCRCHGGCSYCFNDRMIRVRKESDRTSFKLALEDSIDSSTDAMDFFYPEKQVYLDKHFNIEEDEQTTR